MNAQRVQSNFPLTLLEWLARCASVISIVLLASLFVGEGFHPDRIAAKEWLGLLFFPLGVVLGMIVAWWKETIGSVVAVGSLGAFYVVYGFILGSHIGGWWFLAFTLPGFLFLFHAVALRIANNTMATAKPR
jgi:hypothetical protein